MVRYYRKKEKVFTERESGDFAAVLH